MAEARLRHDWDLTCLVVATTHNVHCTRRRDLIDPNQIHPLRRCQTKAVTRRADFIIAALCAAYCRKNN